MDHILAPRNPLYSHPDVPLLCEASFEYPLGSVSFSEYPRRHGYEFDGSLEREVTLHTADEASTHTCLVQRWLSFGLLSEFARRVIRPESFMRVDEEDQGSICTLGLASWLHEWEVDFLNLDASIRLRHYDTLQLIFSHCNEHISMLETWYRDHGDLFPLLGIVSLSISCLATALEISMLRTVNDFPDRVMTSWNYSEYVRRRLKQGGACPQLIRMLEHKLDPPEVYYASLLPWAAQSHVGCDESRCVSNDIDEGTYITQHTKKSCDCSSVAVDYDHLNVLLRAGAIPILETGIGEDGQITLCPVASKERRVYVAISRERPSSHRAVPLPPFPSH